MERLADGAPPRYIALHKPFLTLCSFCDEEAARGRATLGDLGLPDGVLNVGRLDRDSEGLLLLTDDGSFCNRVLQGGGIRKRYCALVIGHPSDAAIEAMAAGGMEIRGRATKACEVRRVDWEETHGKMAPPPPLASTRSPADSTWLEVTLDEGMNRQVRKMTQHAGHKTLRLVRMGIGALRAEDLALRAGEWRHVAPSDVLLGAQQQ